MSSPNDKTPQPLSRERRGSSLTEYFSANRAPPSYPGPITTAAVQASQRRMSTSSTGGSPPTGFGARRGSVSSISSTASTFDESAVEDGDAQGSPTSPFARRMSWGARAFRDVKIPSSIVTPKTTGASSPTIARGFWLDNRPVAPNDPATQHKRRQSISSMPSPPNSMPLAREPPMQRPDDFQERMLKGELDIY